VEGVVVLDQPQDFGARAQEQVVDLAAPIAVPVQQRLQYGGDELP
jgi:hypothetical protein